MQRINIDKIVKNVEKSFYNKINNQSKYKKNNNEKLYYELIFKNIINYNKNSDEYEKLNKINDNLKNEYKLQNENNSLYGLIKNNFLGILKKIFIEESLKEYRFCPYCGINEVFVFSNENGKDKKGKDEKLIQGFDIEHFFPKGLLNQGIFEYNHLSINLYNWLLVCIPCNQRLKRDNNPLVNTSKENPIFHPYFGWIYENKNNDDNLFKILENIDSFSINENYNKDNILNTNFSKIIKIEDYNKNNIDIKKNHIFNSTHGIFFSLNKYYLGDNLKGKENIIIFINDKIEKIKLEMIQLFYIRSINEDNKTIIDEFINNRINNYFDNYYPKEDNNVLFFSYGKLKKDLISYLKDYFKNYNS